MRIIAKRHLQAFGQKYPAAKDALLSWYTDAARATWTTPQDIKSRYASASFVGNNRVIFNIHGNPFRLVAAVAYRVGVLYIKFVGTHAEYNNINALTVELEP